MMEKKKQKKKRKKKATAEYSSKTLAAKDQARMTAKESHKRQMTITPQALDLQKHPDQFPSDSQESANQMRQDGDGYSHKHWVWADSAGLWGGAA